MDAQISNQLRQMVQFIISEAEEKAREIAAKADEEYNSERNTILQNERQKIVKDYERKMKQVEVKRKIEYSNQLNSARLRILKAREDCMQTVLSDAQSRLCEIAKDPNYGKLLESLIIQGLVKMGEDEVEIICREEDDALVRAALPKAIDEYRAITGQQVRLILKDDRRLPPAATADRSGPSSSGGVLLASKEGRILCNNTLDQRLSLAYESLLPELRLLLFGASKSRKFFA